MSFSVISVFPGVVLTVYVSSFFAMQLLSSRVAHPACLIVARHALHVNERKLINFKQEK